MQEKLVPEVCCQVDIKLTFSSRKSYPLIMRVVFTSVILHVQLAVHSYVGYAGS